MTYPLPRAEIASVPLEAHGALDYIELARLGIRPEDVLDFSENSSPYGPSPRVRAALANALTDSTIARYPDRETVALRNAIADYTGAHIEQIVVGNGAAEIIWWIAFAWLHPGDTVLIAGPTFSEYARMAHMMGARVVEVRAKESDDFSLLDAQVMAALAQHQPRLFFICRPNNPTGQTATLAQLEQWARNFPNTLFLVDEAYIDFVPDLASSISLHMDNLLVMCSMTKSHALAGIRLGYAVGAEAVIAALRLVRVPWSVNGLALVAGIAALQDQEYLRRSMASLADEQAAFSRALAEIDFAPVPTKTSYLLLKVGDGAQVRRQLLAHGLVVRDCASFGLPAYIRVSTQLPVANARLIDALLKVKEADPQG